jgi:hypothetical protein
MRGLMVLEKGRMRRYLQNAHGRQRCSAADDTRLALVDLICTTGEGGIKGDKADLMGRSRKLRRRREGGR